MILLRISGLVNLASVRLPTVVEGLQRRKQSKRRPEMTGQTPFDEKVSMEFQMFRRFLFKRFLTPVLFRPALYIGTFGAVISSITSPRFSEACEFGDNFLNGWKLLMEINCSKNFGRQSCIY